MRVAWLAAGVAGLLVAGVALVVIADDDTGPARPGGPVASALTAARRASAPFPHLTETRVQVGGRTLDVVVADETLERIQGLREREHLGSYDGMLFAFDAPTDTSFTMSTVPVALDIGFYDAEGRFVDRLRMEPCARPESRCLSYRADGEFTYALETLAGDLPRGRLAAPG